MYKVTFYFKSQNFNVTIEDISLDDKNKIQKLYITKERNILNQNISTDGSNSLETQIDLSDVRYIEYIKQS